MTVFFTAPMLFANRPRRQAAVRPQRGLSLVELLVSLVLSMAVLVGLA